MKQTWRLHISWLFGVAVLLSILVVSYVAVTFQLPDLKIDNEAVTPLNQGWVLVNGETKTELPELPLALSYASQGNIVIRRRLPEQLGQSLVLCVETNHQSLRAYLEDALLYTYGELGNTPFGRYFGSAWNFIELPPGSAGKTITLELTSSYDTFKGGVYGITLGSKSATVFYLIRQNVGKISFCFLMFLLGTFFILFYLVLKWRKIEYNRISFLWLGISIFIAAFWTLTDSKLPQFWIGNQAVVYMASFFSFMLMPVPFLLFVRGICVWGKRKLDLFCALLLANFLINLILYVLNFIDLPKLLPLTHLLVFLSIAAVVSICYREKQHYHNDAVIEVLLGIFILCCSGFLAVVQFYFSDQSDNSRLLRYGLLGFVFCLSVGTLRQTLGYFHEQLEAKMYKQLAYMDVMTQLGNRAAFDLEMDAMAEGKDFRDLVAVVVFDLNNLKEVNDLYGHMAGDQLIRGLAVCIHTVFGEVGHCFRIGGDEFVALITKGTEVMVPNLLEQCKTVIAEYNASAEYLIDVASGYAVQTGCAETGCPEALFRQADKNMYWQKKAQHQAAGRRE